MNKRTGSSFALEHGGQLAVNPTVSSLALLKVNYDRQRKDYFDNFVPMVVECLRVSPEEVVSLPTLQSDLQQHFGLKLPQNAIKTVLKRARKRNYVTVHNGVYYRNEDQIQDLGFSTEQKRVRIEHESLLQDFVTFCDQRLSISLSSDDADAALQAYLKEHQLQLVNAVTHGTVVPPAGRSVRNFRYLVSSFVWHLQDTASVALNYLETVVKGHILADAIFLPDPGNASRKFRETEVYFDTPFLLNALGYGGEAQKEPCVELIDLLYETGAELRCFTHTRDEIRGVLEMCANQVQSNDTRETLGPESLRNFRSLGYSKSDVMMLADGLEKDLRALHIRIVGKAPHGEREYQIDEDALREELEEAVNYSRPQQVLRDVDSISAIMRLRKGAYPHRLEECRALFVTTNSALVNAVQRKFSDGSRGSVSPCITDQALTNLLWLKKPTAAPDLPRKRIIADCYAAIQPSEHLWKLFLDEIEKLNRMAEVTADQYYMLRNSTAVEIALVEITQGREEGFTEGTVPEILVRVQSNIEAAKQAELDKVKISRESLQGELNAVREEKARRRTSIQFRARHYAEKVVFWFKVLAVVVLATATVCSFGWGLPFINLPWTRYPAIFVLIVLLIFSVASFWNGATVEGIARRLEVALAKRIEQRLLVLVAEEETQDPGGNEPALQRSEQILSGQPPQRNKQG